MAYLVGRRGGGGAPASGYGGHDEMTEDYDGVTENQGAATETRSAATETRSAATETQAGQGAPGEPCASQAVMILLRLFRALERVDTGLTPQQYRILKLAGAGGERSAKLAERLAVARPTLTATADGLVAAGYARRDAEPGDRRVVRLCLTAAGRDAVDRADAAYTRWLDQLLAETGQADQVLHALDVLNQAMDEVRRARLAAPGCAEPDRRPERAGTA